MARHDAAIAQRRRDRQVDAGLADVVGGIGNELGAAFLELGAARLGADRDSITASFADRLHDKLGEVVERVVQAVGLAADVGLYIIQDGVHGMVIGDSS